MCVLSYTKVNKIKHTECILVKAYVQGLGNQQAPWGEQSLQDNMEWAGPISQPVDQGITAFCLEIIYKE